MRLLPFFPVLVSAALLVPPLVRAELPKPDAVVQLWEAAVPGEFTAPGPEAVTEPKPTDSMPILRVTNVHRPRLEIYDPPADRKNGTAVIIVPGGGFGILASGHEGSDLAVWLRDRGVLAAVVMHRCPTNNLPKPWELPAMDTQRAISVLRTKAEELHIKKDRIGLFGFSAGGQVALIAATNAEERLYPLGDVNDSASCRPDFLMLCYPWKILAEGSKTELKPEIKINAKTPPTFIAQANDDTGSLAEGSALAFLALRKAEVSAELHVYSTGGHGFGMLPAATQAPDFLGRLELWLRTRGLLPKP